MLGPGEDSSSAKPDSATAGVDRDAERRENQETQALPATLACRTATPGFRDPLEINGKLRVGFHAHLAEYENGAFRTSQKRQNRSPTTFILNAMPFRMF